MRERTIELVFFEGCPNAFRTRENLHRALRLVGRPTDWIEWDLTEEATPERVKGWGSPTVLVDGLDVTGQAGGTSGIACRADGAPRVDLIVKALE